MVKTPVRILLFALVTLSACQDQKITVSKQQNFAKQQRAAMARGGVHAVSSEDTQQQTAMMVSNISPRVLLK